MCSEVEGGKKPSTCCLKELAMYQLCSYSLTQAQGTYKKHLTGFNINVMPIASSYLVPSVEPICIVHVSVVTLRLIKLTLAKYTK